MASAIIVIEVPEIPEILVRAPKLPKLVAANTKLEVNQLANLIESSSADFDALVATIKVHLTEFIQRSHYTCIIGIAVQDSKSFMFLSKVILHEHLLSTSRDLEDNLSLALSRKPTKSAKEKRCEVRTEVSYLC